MRAIVMLSGFLFAACLGAGLPARAMDLSEPETVVDPEWAGDVLWQRQVGTSSNDDGRVVAIDRANNILISQNNFLAKYDQSGKLLSRRNGAGGIAAMDATGNVVVFGMEDYLPTVSKYSRGGRLLWRHKLDYPQTYPGSAAIDAAGNVLIAGQTTEGYYCCPSDGFVAKYSAAAELVWIKTFGFGYNDGASAVAVDADGNVVVAGWVEPSEITSGDAFVAKYSSDGKLLWTRSFGRPDQAGDQARAVTTDAGKNVVITGSVGNYPDNLLDAFVARYSPAGKLLWSRKLKTAVGDGAVAVATDAARNVVISGWTRGSLDGPNQGSWDAFVAKYSRAGERLWTRQFGTPEDEVASSVLTDATGKVVVAGQTRGSLVGTNHGDMDLFILKLRP